MYIDYYGFKENPFNITSDPSLLFLSHTHKEALNHLFYGITQKKGFIEITGEIGSGKTTLCRAVMSQMPRNTKTSIIYNSDLPKMELLEAILNDFGIAPDRYNNVTFLKQLNRFLIKEYSKGNNVILIIDEAQNLNNDSLEFIRMLSNIETEKEKLLQIVLVGQPELKNVLNSPDLEQLKQRISIRYHIQPLESSEVKKYINHRIETAKPSEKIIFGQKALELITQYSGGIPRKINILCDKALLFGFVKNTSFIDTFIVSKSMEEINGNFAAAKHMEIA